MATNHIEIINENAFKSLPNQNFVFAFSKGSSLETIGTSAFDHCCLTGINLEVCIKLTSIGAYAFQSTLLMSIVLPPSLIGLDNYGVFDSSPLESIEFVEDKITQLVGGTFHRTKLAAFDIPQSLTGINGETFWNTPIKEFRNPNNNQNFTVCEGSLYNKDFTGLIFHIGDCTPVIFHVSCIFIRNIAFAGCTANFISTHQNCSFATVDVLAQI
jgi:hypothetical protein